MKLVKNLKIMKCIHLDGNDIMSNLTTKAGENNCYYNINGKCTEPIVNHTSILVGSGRIWDSQINCVVTQDGAQSVCSAYRFRK